MENSFKKRSGIRLFYVRNVCVGRQERHVNGLGNTTGVYGELPTDYTHHYTPIKQVASPQHRDINRDIRADLLNMSRDWHVSMFHLRPGVLWRGGCLKRNWNCRPVRPLAAVPFRCAVKGRISREMIYDGPRLIRPHLYVQTDDPTHSVSDCQSGMVDPSCR